jgi:hypothetical protein
MSVMAVEKYTYEISGHLFSSNKLPKPQNNHFKTLEAPYV